MTVAMKGKRQVRLTIDRGGKIIERDITPVVVGRVRHG